MKSLSKKTILTVLLFAGILGCERQPAPPLDPLAKTQNDTGSSRTTEQSEQEIIEEMSKLTFEIKVGLSEKKLTIEGSARLTEKIKLVESQAELLRLLNCENAAFSSHSTCIDNCFI